VSQLSNLRTSFIPRYQYPPLIMPLAPITVALDWTPNTNHSGFYVALSQGLYEAAGLAVSLRTPAEAGSAGLSPNAHKSEGLSASKQVAEGSATFGVCVQESVISYATTAKWQHVPLVAVAALCQGNMTTISVLGSSGLTRPKDLEGRKYASFGARWEDAVVRGLVTADGGDGDKLACPPLLRKNDDQPTTGSLVTGSVISTHLSKGLADAAWIFPHWEGVFAARTGQPLTHFHFEDYGVPHGYKPLLIASKITAESAEARAFLKATAEGYKIAANDPAAAANALCSSGHPSLSDEAFVLASASSIRDSYLDPTGKWGRIDTKRWGAFVDFMDQAGMLVDRDGKEIGRENVKDEELFTNAALPE